MGQLASEVKVRLRSLNDAGHNRTRLTISDEFSSPFLKRRPETVALPNSPIEVPGSPCIQSRFDQESQAAVCLAFAFGSPITQTLPGPSRH